MLILESTLLVLMPIFFIMRTLLTIAYGYPSPEENFKIRTFDDEVYRFYPSELENKLHRYATTLVLQ